ncbi:MAG: subtilase-type protease inhibitor [Actinomycetota bacterium]|jgi:hypothetical protein|nr:subtilase-type protease inhibitor [Actinomycetota bacterium]
MSELVGQLRVTVRSGPNAAVKTYTLRCDPPGGEHPDPEAACAALARAPRALAPVPKGLGCTEIYGGPQTATIDGIWRGELVSSSTTAPTAARSPAGTRSPPSSAGTGRPGAI